MLAEDLGRAIMPDGDANASISVVVPVYNGAETLPELVQRLDRVLAACTPVREVILVNDGSHDRSWEVICQLSAQHPWVRGIDLMRNYGQHNALLAGIRAATGDRLITIDDDLQHPPEEIPLLLHELAQGFDVVYGTPREEQHGFSRDLASRLTKLALRAAMGVETARQASAFRVFRTDLRRAFEDYQSPFALIDVLLTWGTTRFAAVPVRHDPRRHGASNYTLRRLLLHALDMTTGFSTLPLQVASVIGFTFTLFGIGVFLYVIARYFINGGSVPGFPFLASLLAIFSGAQLFGLGVVGEYLARIHFRTMGRPSSIIRQSVGFSPGGGEGAA
jgi:undecaprenyl-phosphate 4-deoxy-4-formamido-L-arabinose transferase